jgi:hypothetical protein
MSGIDQVARRAAFSHATNGLFDRNMVPGSPIASPAGAKSAVA